MGKGRGSMARDSGLPSDGVRNRMIASDKVGQMKFLCSMILCLVLPAVALADGLLDGRIFVGLIGPAGSPDLADELRFDDGHFWSGICTECGFVPGLYEARRTEGGIAFTGELESDSRGHFRYDGFVADDGDIRVDITWERKRWYWTNRRALVFQGAAAPDAEFASLSHILARMNGLDIDGNPRCARF